ncbi:ABC transporter ATP-binding protein [Paenibacillus humicola]|uniref:ABC transporter ATP-binding protein n=1 Tax=Paenibacillus humicola TaxID=3110540 RepID=UPI00237B4CD9|nr:dipeptide ABC transporter ATP-binding protein [Paenibacillus humicola]
MSGTHLLKVSGLTKHFPGESDLFGRPTGYVRAVDGVDFAVRSGSTLGIVGESGCGKSTTGRAILRLIEPTSGEIEFDGIHLTKLSSKDMRRMRRHMAIVFQDPFASLNPRMTIRETLAEPLEIFNVGTPKERMKQIEELLEIVGMNRSHLKRYPHEFSGGQRQRIGIARALATKPKLVVADEPVSALDVSIQSQVLNLMQELQRSFGLTYLFISHDLSVVRHISDRVGVMYLGRMMELADKDDLYEEPLHPYTQALLSAVPRQHPDQVRERIILQGDLPSPASPPSGCAFHPRCRECMDICRTQVPEWKEAKPNHFTACHLYA